MIFEFDETKSQSNKQKHGIDFIEAQALWHDERLIEFAARSEDEPRWIVIDMIGDSHYSAIITYRAERTRVISVRRSREQEIALYESS